MISKEYWAGLFDGEGSVTILKPNRRRYRVDFDVRVRVSNTDKKVLELLKAQYGGAFFKSNDGRKNDCWAWQASYKIAMRFMQDVYPFSIIKKKKLKVAIEMQALMSNQRQYIKGVRGCSVPDDIVQRRKQKFQEWKTLQHKV